MRKLMIGLLITTVVSDVFLYAGNYFSAFMTVVVFLMVGSELSNQIIES